MGHEVVREHRANEKTANRREGRMPIFAIATGLESCESRCDRRPAQCGILVEGYKSTSDLAV